MKDPNHRPTAKELLKFKFLKQAKRTNILMDPINKYQKWKLRNPRPEEEEEVADEINTTVRVSKFSKCQNTFRKIEQLVPKFLFVRFET